MTKINSFHEKLDSLHEKIDSIKLVQVEQAKDIQIHIKRTDTLENMVTPVYKVYIQIWGVVKFIAGLAALGGLAWIAKVFKFF